MKNRNRRLNSNNVLEKVESIDDENGNDRSMWRTTWAETIHLFSSVSQNQILKSDDKDNYLPSKFLGRHYYSIDDPIPNDWKMYSYFINRMCCSIFLKTSRRQQLNDQAIDKLLKCVTNFDSLVSVLDFNNDYADLIIERVLRRYWELKALTSPDITVNFVKTIMYNEQNYGGIFDQRLDL